MELTLDNIWAILMENAKQIAAITEERKKEAEERKKEAEERKHAGKKQRLRRSRRTQKQPKNTKTLARSEEKQPKNTKTFAEAENAESEGEKRRRTRKTCWGRRAKKAAEEREKAREKDLQANNRMLKELGRKIAELGDVLGLYAEAQVRERIKHLFDKRGIHLDSVMYHYQQETKNGEFLYEIDILLVNSEYAVITEVKNQLKKDDVDEHIARMEKCTITPPKGAKDKILLGCIGAMIVSPEVETYAKRQGFYLLKPSGESVKMANPANFKHKEWHVIT
ncbi:MAG: hypothetical protein IPN94_03625 [Sphingobacteriales bacterium]|nr:hypothetical protein [Sphingobacteriales bacterium]